MSELIDESTDLGARAARHLREEIVVWVTSVTPSGAPVPRPVWFMWDGGEVVRMYSQETPRVRNLEKNPKVALNFGGTDQGGDVVVFSGEARIAEESPPADQDAEYVEKYGEHIPRIGMTPESFAAGYKVPIEIRLTRLTGH